MARIAGVSGAAITKACKSRLADACHGKKVDLNSEIVNQYLEEKGVNDKPAERTPRGTEANKIKAKAEALKKASSRQSTAQAKKKRNQEKPKLDPEPEPEPEIETSPIAEAPPLEGVLEPLDHDVDGECRHCGRSDIDNHEIPEDMAAFAHLTLGELISRFGTDGAFVDWLKALKMICDIEEKNIKNAEKRGELVSRDLIKRGIIGTIEETFRRMLTDGAKTISADIAALSRTDASQSHMEQDAAEALAKFIKPCKAKMKRVINNV